MAAFELSWNIIYTRPRHEQKVASGLRCLQIEYFLPTAKTLTSSGRRKKYVDAPVFPSYIFARPVNAHLYVESLHLPGVLHYVKTGKEIARIGEPVVQRLRAIGGQDRAGILITDQKFLPGEMHHIQSGPFTGFRCEVIQYHGKYKILVRVEMLQRSLLLDLPVDCLVPA